MAPQLALRRRRLRAAHLVEYGSRLVVHSLALLLDGRPAAELGSRFDRRVLSGAALRQLAAELLRVRIGWARCERRLEPLRLATSTQKPEYGEAEGEAKQQCELSAHIRHSFMPKTRSASSSPRLYSAYFLLRLAPNVPERRLASGVA